MRIAGGSSLGVLRGGPVGLKTAFDRRPANGRRLGVNRAVQPEDDGRGVNHACDQRGGDAADHLGSLGRTCRALDMGCVWPVVGGGFRPGACAVFGA